MGADSGARLSHRLPSGIAAWATAYLALLDELRLAGFIDGQNLNMLGDGFSTPDNEAPAVATALVKASPDAIFAPGLRPARAAQMATKTIPILTLSEDLIADGRVSSLARPAPTRCSGSGKAVAHARSKRIPPTRRARQDHFDVDNDGGPTAAQLT